MTEFWVSKARYWCKFCKCWMSDNKSSRAKHDNGERHKEAVQTWMRENRDRRRAESKEKAELEREMKEIERAARAAFKTDVETGDGATPWSVHPHLSCLANARPSALSI